MGADGVLLADVPSNRIHSNTPSTSSLTVPSQSFPRGGHEFAPAPSSGTHKRYHKVKDPEGSDCKNVGLSDSLAPYDLKIN